MDQSVLDKACECAGRHSKETPPSDPRQRELWGLLEVLDYGCCDQGDFPHATQQEIKQYLKEHREEVSHIKAAPPSYLGFFIGVFDFLNE